MKTLVTGASGFLGRNLLELLGDDAVALVRTPLEMKVPQVKGTPLEPDAWLSEAKGVKVLVHSAGMVHHSRKHSEEMVRFNIDSSLAMVRAAKALDARLVLVSTSGTVGCFEHATIEADEHSLYAEALVGRWPYYLSKIRAEEQSRKLARQLGVEMTVVRPPVLLGPGDTLGRSTTNVARVLNGRLPFIPAGGIAFTDVRDVAQALANLSKKATWRDTYHLPGTALSLRTFFERVGEVAGIPVVQPDVPTFVVKGLAALGSRVPIKKLPDPVVLEMSMCHWGFKTLWSHEELDYRPRGHRQTLSDTVAWLRATQARH
ncbi:NAD dependent epimerase/dehydratase family protein [Myxococcus stipitatus DSM 14675]|uniref:NAD dependent epimerase/dehydratase family protein n=1 Tax=Myxococcus stipitatus (strain DSM 14675 / JCM 12634 / Mx s8) TaxID=1278073 RepID=L7UEM5_MYXSD|nr:NAD-dependent epimerase/dehydratase family protein [Myxococcus stipitatus]AGC47371.1 NAD dependent epimerase/dehydratase family protein [Myxococcus stipitatus DSM 14675]